MLVESLPARYYQGQDRRVGRCCAGTFRESRLAAGRLSVYKLNNGWLLRQKANAAKKKNGRTCMFRGPSCSGGSWTLGSILYPAHSPPLGRRVIKEGVIKVSKLEGRIRERGWSMKKVYVYRCSVRFLIGGQWAVPPDRSCPRRPKAEPSSAGFHRIVKR